MEEVIYCVALIATLTTLHLHASFITLSAEHPDTMRLLRSELIRAKNILISSVESTPQSFSSGEHSGQPWLLRMTFQAFAS